MPLSRARSLSPISLADANQWRLAAILRGICARRSAAEAAADARAAHCRALGGLEVAPGARLALVVHLAAAAGLPPPSPSHHQHCPSQAA